MVTYIHDEDGDELRITQMLDGRLQLLVTTEDWGGQQATAAFGRVDPYELIEAIREEAHLTVATVSEEGADRIDEGAVNDVSIEDSETGKPISYERITADTYTPTTYEEAVGARSREHFDYLGNGTPSEWEEEDPEEVRGAYVHTTPATAEEPRVWAGADEPIIDQLIGRVADLEDQGTERARREQERQRAEEQDAHQHLAEHWERRMDVVQRALTMVPEPGKRGGMAAAFFGEEVEQNDRVEKALKIARFAADEDRDLPGVDK